MASRLGDRVQYGARVVGVQQSDAGVVVHADRHGRPLRFTGDRAICALPATIVRSVDFEPALPAAQRRAVHSMPYLDTTRTYVQVHRALWFDEGVSGGAVTDLPVGSILRQPAADPGAADRRAILESYVSGPEARLLGTLSDDEVVDRTLRGLEEVHPGIGEQVEGAVVQAWSRDPYALGCVSWPGPGDVTRYLRHLQQPHGRVHFAGEHTSILRSTMEGALRSGIRAAGEVGRGG